jgi:hypothetical protein
MKQDYVLESILVSETASHSLDTLNDMFSDMPFDDFCLTALSIPHK